MNDDGDGANSNSLHILSRILVSCIITELITAIITAVTMNMFCEVKCRRRNRTTASPHNSKQSHDRTLIILAEPL